jgi:hypothetical protein
MATENRQDRIARLKRKFLSLTKIQRLLEFVRYDRAKNGDILHGLPQDYVEECRDALWEMVLEDFENDRGRVDRLLTAARKRPSEPFSKVEANTPAK